MRHLTLSLLLLSGSVHATPATRAEQWDAMYAAPLTPSLVFDTNERVNRWIRYQSDQITWNAPYHWATPAELVHTGSGDCEDYALTKYLILRRAGLPAADLRLGVVMRNGEQHMVLFVHSECDDDPMVLDSLATSIRRLSQRTDLSVVLTFNEHDVWSGNGGARIGSSKVRLPK